MAGVCKALLLSHGRAGCRNVVLLCIDWGEEIDCVAKIILLLRSFRLFLIFFHLLFGVLFFGGWMSKNGKEIIV